MLLPGCPCCTPAGCTCPGFYNGGTTVLVDTTNNCCSPTKCLPCSITMELLPGNTWNGFYAGYLSATDKAEIISALSISLVVPIASVASVPSASTPSVIYSYTYNLGGTVAGPSYSASLAINTYYGCDKWQMDAGWNELSVYRSDGAGNTVPWATLSSGKQVMDWFFKATNAVYGSTTTGGFSLSEWCGTSFDKTVSWFNGNSIFTGYVNLRDPSVPNSGCVRSWGTQMRYTG